MIPDRPTADTAVLTASEGPPKGFPSRIALDLAQQSGAVTFVETGTYRGITTRWASSHFEKVYTIERADNLFNTYSASLRSLGNVQPLLGDSRVMLREIIGTLDATPAVFWLDGHWSGGETAGHGDECPLMDELALMSRRTGDMVFIDDARFFLSAPPKPHNPSHWPTIVDVIEVLRAGGNRPFVQVVDDVIISIPDIPVLKKCLIEYAQERADIFWSKCAGIPSGAVTGGVFSRIFHKVQLLLHATENST